MFPEEQNRLLKPNIQVIGSMGNGQKAIRLEDLPAEAWRTISGEHQGGEIRTLFEAVPWLRRGVKVRANVLSKVPFAIFDGDNEIDTSINYQNVVGWWPNPRKDLALIEASLTMTGRAYLHKTRSKMGETAFIQKLRYLAPQTVNPILDRQLGLVGFRRVMPSADKIPLDDIVWIWHPDYSVEIGPPHDSPATNASRAAGVLFNVDNFTAAFFERGAIKASILATPRGTLKDSRNNLKRWWERAISGIGNAWKTEVINADDVKVITIGEGIAELSNVELTKEKRQDISAALGVPQNILFSDDANFATAKQDDFRLLDQTVEPEAILIEGFLNELLFSQLKNPLQFKFFPKTMQISQEEEVDRSAALVNMERSGFPPWDAAKILGFDVPKDMDVEKAIKEYQIFKASIGKTSSNAATDQGPITGASETRSALQTYESHAIKRFENGKSIKGTKNATPFDGHGEVSETLLASIGGALNNVKNISDIKRIFADAKQWENYP